MKNCELNINKKFLAALIILIGLFSGWVGIVLAIIILALSEDDWLKRVLVRFLAVMFLYYMIYGGAYAFEQLMWILEELVEIPSMLTYIVTRIVTLVKYVYLGLMAYKAYQGKIMTFGLVEKIVRVIYAQGDVEVNNQSNFCAQCGSALNADDVFCKNCGTRR